VNLNNKAGLERTILSVVNQTYQHIEYIIIDGASTDDSTTVIQDYSDHIDKCVSEPDNGVYHAMNKGIEMATGEYLLFLNSGDTFFEVTTIEKAIRYLQEVKTDLLYGDLRFDHGSFYEDFKYPDNITFDFLYHRSLGHPATFIKRGLFEKLGYYDESYPICADWVFFTKAICLHTCSYKHLPFVIAIFATDGVSSLSGNAQKIEAERKRALKGPFKFLTEHYERYINLKD